MIIVLKDLKLKVMSDIEFLEERLDMNKGHARHLQKLINEHIKELKEYRSQIGKDRKELNKLLTKSKERWK